MKFSGNHALALCYHGAKQNVPVTVVMPVFAPLMKITLCRSYGATVILKGNNIQKVRFLVEQLWMVFSLLSRTWKKPGKKNIMVSSSSILLDVNDFQSPIPDLDSYPFQSFSLFLSVKKNLKKYCEFFGLHKIWKKKYWRRKTMLWKCQKREDWSTSMDTMPRTFSQARELLDSRSFSRLTFFNVNGWSSSLKVEVLSWVIVLDVWCYTWSIGSMYIWQF